MLSTSAAVSGAPLPARVQSYIEALVDALHSCYFCYHERTAVLEEEVAFFNRRLGTNRTLVELLSLRRQPRPSFAFVIRCLPTIARLQLRTARDHRFPRAA